MKKEKRVEFGKAISILDGLLQGKTPKQAAYDVNLPSQRVYDVKQMFPLFLGLPRKNKRHTDDE